MLEDINNALCCMFLQVQSVAPQSTFGVKFHKCAQVHQQNCLNTAQLMPTYFAASILSYKWRY